jgi:hypothetical protein
VFVFACVVVVVVVAVVAVVVVGVAAVVVAVVAVASVVAVAFSCYCVLFVGVFFSVFVFAALLFASACLFVNNRPISVTKVCSTFRLSLWGGLCIPDDCPDTCANHVRPFAQFIFQESPTCVVFLHSL